MSIALPSKLLNNKPTFVKRSLAKDCNNQEEVKRLKRFKAMFGSNDHGPKLYK